MSAPLEVGFLVFPRFQLLDLSGPLATFDSPGGYRCRVLSTAGGPVASSAGIAVLTEPPGDTQFDTFVVVGGLGTVEAAGTAAIVEMVRLAAARSRRVASVCTGAFVLAAAGLLDGRRATTHWRHVAHLQRLHPQIRVEGDRIFTRDGAVWTSAGITSGIDLALAMVEEDLGIAASRAVARNLVVYHRRPGGQSQFSTLLEMEPESDRIRRALGFAREHLAEPLPVGRLAQAAALSPRQFGRAFLAETGETPARAIERLRAEAARTRIENTAEPIEAIAAAVGFTDPERMRRAFLRIFGQPPQGMRRASRVLSSNSIIIPAGAIDA
ncbi:transcriptional regulator GlxA family with amidase domain [Stella humosa]|uniref:Transcriptional regulator GlxA family with amidase domain n=1 Tax=Stella humosa TaxID=94 RepID=A0A3N1KRI7_9PROT|nr:GlxA family transcriptional regulator [Stella humosa]ROP81409.1 transcriptional regulator GlxA family with amidase domain [Stella humosa]BBK32761.1 AraC family transcriptional regulator [Stella humosa]